MRGDERIQDGMFSYVRLEQRVPEDHPLRAVRKLTDQVLRSLSPGFDELYAASGRPSIAPEYILRALLLQVFYSIRSERLLVEQIDYNLLFSLVRRPRHGRCSVEPRGVFEEPESVVDQRGRATVLQRGQPAGEALHER